VAGEEVRNQNFREHIKTYQLKIIDAIDISPYFFIRHQPSICTRGYGGRIRWRLTVGKVAVDAMMEGRGNTR
jgi:hypothetical protein